MMNLINRPLLRSFNMLMDFYFLLPGYPSGILNFYSIIWSMDLWRFSDDIN